MTKNLLSICQITRSGCYVLFEPNDMIIHDKIQAEGTTMMARKKAQAMYVMSFKEAYVENPRKSETPNLCLHGWDMLATKGLEI